MWVTPSLRFAMNDSEQSSGPSSSAPDEPDSPGGVRVVLDADADDPPDTDWLTAHARRLTEALQLQRIDLSVVIIADDVMAELHEQHCGVPGTTDVITFDLADEPPGAPEATDAIDGELYVCLDEARRVAKRRGHPVQHELLLYITHGVLHLLGYDDHDPRQYDAMHAREDELLESIGIGPVFGAKENPPS